MVSPACAAPGVNLRSGDSSAAVTAALILRQREAEGGNTDGGVWIASLGRFHGQQLVRRGPKGWGLGLLQGPSLDEELLGGGEAVIHIIPLGPSEPLHPQPLALGHQLSPKCSLQF